MPKKSLYLVAIISTFSFLACNKDDKNFVNAIVVDSGDLSSKGCGYLLQFEDGTIEKPYQLYSAYQNNGMHVKVKYHYSDVADTCGSSAPFSYYQLIIIDEIKLGDQPQP
ncbi:MAG: hypothetical protein QM743_08255 [Chitinophagaceae bacterium]|uniref:DUF4377 domain-containing protein n=1 Tax=Rurimicrobium arvi TaxID=2049916 RepID=A0ABP8MGH3_9BACT